MTIPVGPRIGALVLATTAFYGYVGQMVPQNEVQPPAPILIRADLTTDEMVGIGRDISTGKGLCRTCHTLGQTGALRFPDLEGVDVRAMTRIPGLTDIEYFAQSLYEPDRFIVPGFNPGMPTINRPPIALTDQEILCVIAYLQSLGGTPTVTLQTAHAYYKPPAAAPGAPGAPGAAPGGPPDQNAEPGQPQPLAAPPAEKAAPPGTPVAPAAGPASAAPATGGVAR